MLWMNWDGIELKYKDFNPFPCIVNTFVKVFYSAAKRNLKNNSFLHSNFSHFILPLEAFYNIM
jgi:hypothetical protein